MEECVTAFEDLKQYLSSPPILSKPEKEEVLYAYLVVTDYVVSLVLVRSEEVAPLFSGSHYSGAYPTSFASSSKEIRLYRGQILVDFVVEFAEGLLEKEEKGLGMMVASAIVVLPWEVYADGATNRKGARIGILLITPEKLVMEKSMRLSFLAANNEAKYEALLAEVAMVKQLGGDVVDLYSDFRLVVSQVNGEFKARDERLQRYLARVQRVRAQFKSFALKQIPRGQNAHAESLAMLATSLKSKLPWLVIVKDMVSSSLIREPVVGVHSIQVGLSWMDPIVTFLKQGLLPDDKDEAKKVRRSASRYWLSEEQKLYKRSYSRPYLLCVQSSRALVGGIT
ncbi:uncharacterized protein LOC142612433 [Castanea sativa]|uniref:uncharacterized protein LOC142612433 n=1 Tax=Castanea sativa TaxID=21020 RepID=UPI003F64AA2B